MLRQAVAADVPGMHRVRMSVVENRLISTVITEEDARKAIEESGRGWVVEVDGRIVGFAVVNIPDRNVWALFVEPAFEGKGYGRLLHDAMLEWSWAQGIEHLWLSTQPETRAQRFYERAGWRNVGITEKGEVRFQMPSPRDRQANHFSFRPLARDDLAMLHQWVQRPHVAEWWAEPRALTDIENEYLPVVEGASSTKAYLACLDGVPFGFIQAYVVKDSGDGWWEGETDPGARGIDQFIADAGRLNQGLGTAMVRAFVQRLFQAPEVTKVQTDPSPENQRAIRCYTKAGFQPVGKVATPDGPALLMVCER